MIPVLEMTFSGVVGDPWQGQAAVRFQGDASSPFAVREGLSGKQRGEIRWYIEEYMDLPEGGNLRRAQAIEQQLAVYGRQLWDGIKGGAVETWLGAVRALNAGRLELRAATRADEVAFRTPWELMRVGGSDGAGGMLLHQLGVTVVRRVNAELPRLQPLDTSAGLRVLAIVCRPEEAGFLDPRYTPEAILTALESRSEVSVDFCRPGTMTGAGRGVGSRAA